jgi:hypothetical protein
MSLQVIPLSSLPNQEFSVQLDLNGNPLVLNVVISYNEMASYWTLTVSDTFNNLLLDSIPLVVGSWPAANIMHQYDYLKIGAWYIINVSNLVAAQTFSIGYGEGGYGGGPYGGSVGGGGSDWPNNTNLGTDFQLWIEDNLLYMHICTSEPGVSQDFTRDISGNFPRLKFNNAKSLYNSILWESMVLNYYPKSRTDG